MRAYGLEVIVWPDVADIKEMGSKSSVGTLAGKGGECRGMFRNKAAKAAVRRGWKRMARAEGKRACREVE